MSVRRHGERQRVLVSGEIEMTRKDFELIAQTIRRVADRYPNSVVADALTLDMADALGTAYQSFDRERFLAACRGDR